MFDAALRVLSGAVLRPMARAVGAVASPNTLTALGFIAGLLSALAASYGTVSSPDGNLFLYLFGVSPRVLAVVMWLVNRFLDGLDGVVARETGTQSDYGGYFDLLCDFTVYGVVALGLASGAVADLTGGSLKFIETPSATMALLPADTLDAVNRVWAALGWLETAYFVNAAGLFYLSAMYERRVADGLRYNRGTTTVAMNAVGGRCLVEGGETMAMYTTWFLVRDPLWITRLMNLFSVAVTITIVQRLLWARRHMRG